MVYLNAQKLGILSKAAILANELVFTHKMCSASNSSRRCASFQSNVSLGVGEVARPTKAL